MEQLIQAMMRLNPKETKESAKTKIENIKTEQHPKIYARYLQNVFKQMGIEVSTEKVLKEFEKYC